MRYTRLIPVVAALALAATLTGCGKDSTPTSPDPLDTAPPPAPTGVEMATERGTGAYLLQWTPSPSPRIDRYQVFQYLPDPSRDNAYVMIGETTRSSYVVPSPDEPTVATFRVTAVDNNGKHSAFSISLTVTMTPTLGQDGGGGGSPSTPGSDPRRRLPD